MLLSVGLTDKSAYCQYKVSAGRQFLQRAADWPRILDIIQLADILGCGYWCLFVK